MRLNAYSLKFKMDLNARLYKILRQLFGGEFIFIERILFSSTELFIKQQPEKSRFVA